MVYVYRCRTYTLNTFTAESKKRPQANSGDETSQPDEGQSKRRHKKSKRKRTRSLTPSVKSERKDMGGGFLETEEEYDARLEREENERRDVERRNELERMKKKYENEVQTTEGGIHFKGIHTRLSCLLNLSNFYP